jgi:hypothetical protein
VADSYGASAPLIPNIEGAGAPGKRKMLSTDTLEAELAVAAETTATLAAQQQILKDKLAAEQDKVAAAARAELHLSGDNSRMASLLEKMEAQFEKMEAASAACEHRAATAELKVAETKQELLQVQQEIGMLKLARANPAPDSPVHERLAAAAPHRATDIAAAAATIQTQREQADKQNEMYKATMARMEKQFADLHAASVQSMQAELAKLYAEKAANMMRTMPPPVTPLHRDPKENAPASAPPAVPEGGIHVSAANSGATIDGVTINVVPPTPPGTPTLNDVSQLIKDTFSKAKIEEMVTAQRLDGGMAPSFKRHLKDLLIRRARDTTGDATQFRAYVDTLGMPKKCRNASIDGAAFKNQLVAVAKALAATGRGTEDSE